MWEVDKMENVLYAYLRLLSVKVSKQRIHKLLDTPMRNSMRGISDVLDELHIQNEVYQLPMEYFEKLQVPFISMLNTREDPFCIVEEVNSIDVVITTSTVKHLRLLKDKFIEHWTGGAIVAEATNREMMEPFFYVKNITYWVNRCKVIVLSLLLLFLGLTNVIEAVNPYLFCLWSGIIVSVIVIYKTDFNENFLRHFCQIGRKIDCNQVLHSKAGSLFGWLKLGEISLIFFTTLFSFTLINSKDFVLLSMFTFVLALGFTLYSLFYQMMHKWCLLCMLINLLVWGAGISLFFIYNNTIYVFSWMTLFQLVGIGLVNLIVWLELRTLLQSNKKNVYLEALRGLLIAESDIFSFLLQKERMIIPPKDILLTNAIDSLDEVLVVTNPNCANCIRTHKILKKMSHRMKISLMFITYADDEDAKYVIENIMAAYQVGGWEEAILLLEYWFEHKKLYKTYPLTSEVQIMRKGQLEFLIKFQITETPLIIVNGHVYPSLYTIGELNYVV